MQSRAVPRNYSGRVTPKKGGPARPAKSEKWELQQSRQVTTPWAWRGMLFLSLIAIGVGIILLGNHDSSIGVLWMVIAAGWFGFAMMLWRKHSQFIKRG
jgi:hypothetical protein